MNFKAVLIGTCILFNLSTLAQTNSKGRIIWEDISLKAGLSHLSIDTDITKFKGLTQQYDIAYSFWNKGNVTFNVGVGLWQGYGYYLLAKKSNLEYRDWTKAHSKFIGLLRVDFGSKFSHHGEIALTPLGEYFENRVYYYQVKYYFDIKKAPLTLFKITAVPGISIGVNDTYVKQSSNSSLISNPGFEFGIYLLIN